MQTDKVLTDDDFYAKYHPEFNQVELQKKDPAVKLEDMCSYGGCMYETFGEDIAYVIAINKESPGRVWTILAGGDWECISSGFHLVNRMGYLITKEECESETESYTLYDESEVNDWIQEQPVAILAKVLPDFALVLPEEGIFEELDDDLQDQMLSEWHEIDLDEREKLMKAHMQQ